VTSIREYVLESIKDRIKRDAQSKNIPNEATIQTFEDKKAKQFKIKIEKLKEVISLLVNEAQLPEKYKDHKLTGNYKNRREL